MGKKIFLLGVRGLIVILAYGSVAWGAIEYIQYISKGDEFNYWSVKTLVISILAIIVLSIMNKKIKIEPQKETPKKKIVKKKSEFQKRLEERYGKIKHQKEQKDKGTDK